MRLGATTFSMAPVTMSPTIITLPNPPFSPADDPPFHLYTDRTQKIEPTPTTIQHVRQGSYVRETKPSHNTAE